MSKAAPVLQNLKWVRQAAGNLVPGLVLCAGLDLGSPMVNSLVRIGTNPARNKIELVVKAGAWDDALVDLSGAVVQFDAPAELVQGGRRLVKQPGDGVPLPLRVVEQGTGQELAVSAATQQYQLSHYLDEAGKSVLLISRALDGGGSGDSDCEVCNNRSVAALYRTVCERAGGTLVAEAGLNRICERVTDDSRLQAMGEEWLGWNATSLNAFFGDVTQTGAGSNHIASRLAELTLGWVKAWEVLYIKNSNLRNNYYALNIITDYVSRYPGNSVEIVEFLTNSTTVNWPPPGSPFTYRVEQALNDVVSIQLYEQFPELKLEELIAVHHNTRGVYFPLNRALRGEAGMNPFLEIFTKLINRGLSKLEPYIGITWRGTSIPETLLFSKYENAKLTGTPITELDFTSSSAVTDFLNMYMNRTVNVGEVRVVIEIESINGRYIDPISKFGVNFQATPANIHHEVVFASGTRFSVAEFDLRVSADGNEYYYMKFVEIP